MGIPPKTVRAPVRVVKSCLYPSAFFRPRCSSCCGGEVVFLWPVGLAASFLRTISCRGAKKHVCSQVYHVRYHRELYQQNIPTQFCSSSARSAERSDLL